jgi:RNA polymerase sigma factor (sigma-70 family)
MLRIRASCKDWIRKKSVSPYGLQSFESTWTGYSYELIGVDPSERSVATMFEYFPSPFCASRLRWRGVSRAHPKGLASCRHNRSVDTAVITTPRSAPVTEEITLAQWVQAIAATRSQDALGKLYEHCIARVHSLVRRYLRDEALVEEICADVFYQVWMQAERFDADRGPVMAWLLNMARSRALDAWRRQNSNPVIADDDLLEQAQAWLSTDASDDALHLRRIQQAVQQALAQVSPSARQMIALAFFQGLSHSEISAHLQTPLGTVKTTIRRALLSLRDTLQPHMNPTSWQLPDVAEE